MTALRQAGYQALAGLLAPIVLDRGIPAFLLALGALTIVPLGAGLAGVDRRLIAAATPAGLLLLASIALPAGLLAGGLALPWLALTAALAIVGASRLLARWLADPAEASIDAALVLVVVGGAWAALDRLGQRPMGFDPLIVQLTAVHFHYAGFALPLLAGLAGRARPGGLPTGILLAVLAGLPLVAAGLTISQAVGQSAWETAPALVMAAAAAAVAVLQFGDAARKRSLLLAISSLSLLGAMVLAAAYGVSRARPASWPTMGDMFRLHGLVNALGFSLLGLVARALAPPPARLPPLLVPRGPRARGGVGVGWFASMELVDADKPAPAGQLDALEDLAWEGFDPAAVHPEVRDFYERTGGWELWVRPRWPALFALPGRIFAALAARVGQVALPVDEGGRYQLVTAAVMAARASPDLPPGTRIYERCYADGRPMFMAAYASLPPAPRPCLCVMLPLPFAALVSVIRLETLPRGGLRIRSARLPGSPGSEGIYLNTGPLKIRLPLDEHLELGPLAGGYAPPSPGGPPGCLLGAIYRFTFLGRTCLELDYLLRPVPGS